MKLLLLRVLLSTLFFLLCSALPTYCPAPAPAPACIGGSYENCVGSFVCVMSFPESCTCGNANKTKCAAACGTTPTLQNCSGGAGNAPQR